CAEILYNAIKIDYWDIDAMADAIYSIITYPSMYSFLKNEGKKEVDEIKWEYAALKVRKVYDMVLGH
ncbi:MAG: glycosyltransferase family 1 protein, partial [Paludibacteraceae bacterium]|nr:glycosyltransferase family 1 protein [Paludibacteraceae bacterium]